MGIGVIVRNNYGEVLAILSSPKDHIIDLVIVEATIALRVVTFTRELSFYKVILKDEAL
jgi:hypothetical protein